MGMSSAGSVGLSVDGQYENAPLTVAGGASVDTDFAGIRRDRVSQPQRAQRARRPTGVVVARRGK